LSECFGFLWVYIEEHTEDDLRYCASRHFVDARVLVLDSRECSSRRLS
jgi:hypothetical protein